MNWPSHLAEIVYTYTATHSTVTGYSLYNLMFGLRPKLSVDFYFPTVGGTEAPMREASAKCVDKYIASVQDRLRTTLWEVKTQLMEEVYQQKWYYNQKIGAVNLVLVKADAFKQRRKIKDRWEEDTWDVMHQIATDIPSYEMTD